MTRILVTGAAGYIGRFVCQALARADLVPVMYDDFSRGRSIPSGYGIVEDGTMTGASLDAALAKYEPRGVIHLAGGRGGRHAAPNSEEDKNISFTRILLAALERTRTRHVMLASSSAVYGEAGALPVREEAPLRAASGYGRAKIAAEALVRAWGEAPGRHWTILRLANAAGADPADGLGWYPEDRTLVPSAIAVAAGERAVLPVYGTGVSTADGTAVRDFIHARDIAAAFVHLLQQSRENGRNDILNVSTGRGHSITAVIARAREITARPIPVEYRAGAGNEIASLILSPARLAGRGFVPRHSDLAAILSSGWEWHRRIPA